MDEDIAKKTRKLTKEQVAFLLAQASSGTPHRILAAQYSIDTDSVRYHLLKAGIVSKADNKTHKLSPERTACMVEEYKAGATTRDLEAKYDVSKSTVFYWLRKAGIPTRSVPIVQKPPSKRRRYSREIENQITELRLSGVSRREISRRVDVPLSKVKDVLVARGITIPIEERQKNACTVRNANLPEKMMAFARESARSRKGECLEQQYATSKAYMSWRCEKDHKFQMNLNSVQQGQWCPRCAHVGPSDAQLEIAEYVRSLLSDEEVVVSDRTAIKPMELDVYVPSRRFALEYNGLLWHSSWSSSYDRFRHHRKALACHAASIKLLAIFSDEWVNLEKQKLIKTMIRWRLGKFDGKRLDARSLELRQLKKNSDWRDFFDRNHIDGYAIASWGYGLFHEGKLVMCATVRRNFSGESEVARLATDYDYSVRGGAARLISAIKANVASVVVAYSNNRLSSGAIYEKLGFKKLASNGPSYWYTDGVITRLWRHGCRRINDPVTLARYPTEKEQALGGVFSKKYFGDDRPLYQLHDYGHLKWVLI